MDPQGHQDKRKSTQGKDAKLTKRNKNITSALPDRVQQQRDEEDVLSRMAKADTRQEGHGKKYGLDTMAAIIALRRDGKTWDQIAKMERIGNIRLPKMRSTTYLLQSNPEFAEGCKRARKDRERNIAEDGIESIPLVGKSARRMRGMNRINGLAQHARLALALGRQSLADDYGGEQEGEPEVIVMEVSGGWVPTTIARGGPGQGTEADAAQERWRKIREEGDK